MAKAASSAVTASPAAARDIVSVGEAIEAVTDDTFMKDLRPRASAKRGDNVFGLWFRGHARSNYELTPGILRQTGGGYVDEVSLVRHFKAMNPDAAPATASDFDWLVTMQHYLAPTRLLDWSENLLVALYFAVRDEALDGVADSALWLLNARRLNYLASATARMAELAFPADPDVIARSVLARSRERLEWHDTFQREMRRGQVDRADYRIERIQRALATTVDRRTKQGPVLLDGAEVNGCRDRPVNLRAFAPAGAKGAKLDLFGRAAHNQPEGIFTRLRLPVAVYPARANDRIRSQAGVFTLHGGRYVHNPASYPAGKTSTTSIGAPLSLVELNAGFRRDKIVKWLCIPAAARASIRRSLALMGVTEATLFPELDYQSRYLVQRWTYREDADVAAVAGDDPDEVDPAS